MLASAPHVTTPCTGVTGSMPSSLSLDPGVEPGPDPRVGPGFETGLEVGLDPGLDPGLEPEPGPGVDPGPDPGVGPEIEPGLEVGFDPGLGSGLDPGLEPGPDLSSGCAESDWSIRTEYTTSGELCQVISWGCFQPRSGHALPRPRICPARIVRPSSEKPRSPL